MQTLYNNKIEKDYVFSNLNTAVINSRGTGAFMIKLRLFLNDYFITFL